MYWLFDFDDTLVLGPNTWAFEVAMPEFIEKYELPYEKEKFDNVMLEAQKRGAEDASEAELLNYVFGELNWRDELKQELVNRVFYEYTPHLFDDTLQFLQAIRDKNQQMFIISNNQHVHPIAEKLGIADYFEAIYAPVVNAGLKPKPAVDLWKKLQSDYNLTDLANVRMVGDDPWSDGTFSQRCGFSCWILDRLNRYTSLHANLPYRWINTLDVNLL